MLRLRPALAALVPALLVFGLAACGATKTGYGDKTASGFSAVSVTGGFGKTPKLSWKSEMSYPDSTTVRTLIHGNGAKIAKGKNVLVRIYIGNGTTEAKKWAYASAQPEQVSSTAGPGFEQLLAGTRIGDRREAVVSSENIFGANGAPDYGIGNHDALVIVLDVVSDPNPHDVAASKLPKLELHGNTPTGFDFAHTKKPTNKTGLLRSVLKKGKGKTVTANMTVTANYLGMTYGATKPFDESYSKKAVAFSLSQVVPGWTNGLTGMKVGSRVLLQIPPQLGYGSTKKPASSKAYAPIPANSTLYFVIDIVKAQTTPSSSATGQ